MLSGKELTGARTLGSRYDHNCIELTGRDEKHYRISADVILEALKQCNFETRDARVHTYLTLA